MGLPAVALASGTAAIHLGLRLLGVGPGDEVFCPTLTFAASCNPVRYLGAEPVFLDSDHATWNLDPDILEDALRARARRNKLPQALVVVAPVWPVRRHGPHPRALRALRRAGARRRRRSPRRTLYRGKPAGTLGESASSPSTATRSSPPPAAACSSRRNAAWVEKARFWSQQARDPGLAYEHSELGYNYRMSNVLAGIGRGQLEVLDLRVQQRRAIAFRYRDAFADLPGISLMPQAPYGLHTNWLSCFLIDESKFGCSRDELIRALDAANVESRPVWKPMHLQPLYAGCERYGGEVAEDLFRRGICLPSSSSLTLEDQLYVVNQVRDQAAAAPLAGLEEPVPAAECSQ